MAHRKGHEAADGVKARFRALAARRELLDLLGDFRHVLLSDVVIGGEARKEDDLVSPAED